MVCNHENLILSFEGVESTGCSIWPESWHSRHMHVHSGTLWSEVLVHYDCCVKAVTTVGFQLRSRVTTQPIKGDRGCALHTHLVLLKYANYINF